jgi:hypothetical protein
MHRGVRAGGPGNRQELEWPPAEAAKAQQGLLTVTWLMACTSHHHFLYQVKKNPPIPVALAEEAFLPTHLQQPLPLPLPRLPRASSAPVIAAPRGLVILVAAIVGIGVVAPAPRTLLLLRRVRSDLLPAAYTAARQHPLRRGARRLRWLGLRGGQRAGRVAGGEAGGYGGWRLAVRGEHADSDSRLTGYMTWTACVLAAPATVVPLPVLLGPPGRRARGGGGAGGG